MHLHHKDEEDSQAARNAAAILIQRLWRNNRKNIAREEHLNAEVRWKDTATHARLKVSRDAALEGDNSPKQRWRRAALFAAQLQDKDDMLKEEGVEKTDAEEKFLETQHWLELIDGKHRYGSNLKYYHQRWQDEDTTDNFFKWLDYGAGKDLSLDECPRETLEKERIIYLSAEQRLNYLVKINKDGKLYWAKNNQLVDTSAGDWKDAGEGGGIVPDSVPTSRGSGSLHLGKSGDAASTNAKAKVPFEGRRPRAGSGSSSISSMSSSSLSEMQDNEATHYAGPPKGKYRWSRYLRRHFTPKGIMQRLLRKTVRRNTWIYVSDKHFNIFVGIKETGAFQHSSFTAGGIVTSAGLISVKQGTIYTLSPLSGHYRTSTNHFHKFIDVLTERGVDMHKIKISKAEAALWGIEHLAKFKKAQGKAVSKGKEKIAEVPGQVKEVFSSSKDSEAKEDDEETRQWKNDVLHGRQKKKASQPEPSEEKEGASTPEKGPEGLEGPQPAPDPAEGQAEREEEAPPPVPLTDAGSDGVAPETIPVGKHTEAGGDSPQLVPPPVAVGGKN